jgi:hypothetical protein
MSIAQLQSDEMFSTSSGLKLVPLKVSFTAAQQAHHSTPMARDQ